MTPSFKNDCNDRQHFLCDELVGANLLDLTTPGKNLIQNVGGKQIDKYKIT